MSQHKQQIKKRKYDNIAQEPLDVIEVDTDEFMLYEDRQEKSIEHQVFDNMTKVNSGLITLNSKLLSVDYSYMLNHCDMVDEFVDNIHLFLGHLGVLRKKLASERLNTDTISFIYQFLDSKMILCTCQYVSKIWRESLSKTSLYGTLSKKKSYLIRSMKNFKFANRITSLDINKPSLDSIKVLCKTKRLKGLENLSLTDLGVQSISQLCSTKRLKPKKLVLNSFFSGCVEKMLSSQMVSNLESLELLALSTTNNEWDNVKLSKLTNLEVTGRNLINFNDRNIVCNLMAKCPLLKCVKLSYMTFFSVELQLPVLERLVLEDCEVTKSFLSQLVSSRFPNLKYLELKSITVKESNTDTKLDEPNPNCPIKELKIMSNIQNLALITKYCKNIKSLSLQRPLNWYHPPFDFSDYFSAECLYSLETLELIYFSLLFKPVMDLLFPNLKKLIYRGNEATDVALKLLENCTSLVSLEKLSVNGVLIRQQK